MVGSLPGSSLILFGSDFSPYFSVPVKNTDRIEALFVGSSSSKNYNLVGNRIVVDGAIGAMSGFLSKGVDLLPSALGGVVCPEIVHVVGIWMFYEIPA